MYLVMDANDIGLDVIDPERLQREIGFTDYSYSFFKSKKELEEFLKDNSDNDERYVILEVSKIYLWDYPKDTKKTLVVLS